MASANVADQVSQQVGFSVTLLDSKCFPIMENDATSETEFWRLNRNILAASSSLYTKLVGSYANPNCARGEIDLTCSEDELDIPVSKCQLDRILDEVQSLTRSSDIVDKTISVYECVICKDIMQKPQYVPCCKRVIGCSQCVQHWFDDHDTCPHCSVRGSTAAYINVHGMDDMLTML